MKNLLALLALILFFPGCGNMSPISDMQNDIDNQGGQIQELQELQNSINLEVGNLQHQSEINADSINNLQQGLVNSSNENSGFQMFQGSGGLIFAFATIVIVLMFLLMYYREKYSKNEKALEILAEEVVKFNDIDVENAVFSKAMTIGVEKEILMVIKRNQRKFGIKV